jgi:hypothetical protein
MGDVIFHDLVLADNLVAGFEVEEDDNEEEDPSRGLDGAFIVGITPGNCI